MTIFSENPVATTSYQIEGIAEDLGILEVGREGVITFANDALVNLTGYEIAELIGMRIETLVPRDVRDKHRRKRKEYSKHPHSRSMNYGQNLRLLTKSGNAVAVSISLHANSVTGGAKCILRPADYSSDHLKSDRVQLVVNSLRYAVNESATDDSVSKIAIQGISEILEDCLVVFWRYDGTTNEASMDMAFARGLRRASKYKPQSITKDSQIGNSILGLRDILVPDQSIVGSLSLPQELVDEGVNGGLSLVVPGRFEPVGVIGIYSNTPGKSISRSDIDELRQVASALGFTLSRLGAETALRRELELQTALTRISNLISNASDLSECFSQVSDCLQTVINHDRMVIASTDDDQLFARDEYIAGTEIQGDGSGKVRIVQGSDLDQLINKKIQYILIGSETDRTGTPEAGENLRLDAGLSSMLAVGLTSNSKTVGVLTFRSKHTGAFGVHQVEIVSRIAEVLGAHLVNSMLSRQINEQLSLQRMLSKIASIASSNLVIEDLYAGVAHELASVVHYDRFSISEFGERTTKIAYVRGQQVDRLTQGTEFKTSKKTDSSSTARELLLENEQTRFSSALLRSGLKSRLKILIGDVDEPLALIVLSRYSESGFTLAEESLMIQIANQLMPALESAFEHQKVVRLAEQLAESDARFSELFNNAPDAIISVDASSGLITDFNQMAISTLQAAGEDLYRKHYSALYHPDFIDDARKIIKQFQATGQVEETEANFINSEGDPFRVSINIAGVRNSNGKIIRGIATIRDISHVAEAERVMKVARAVDAENRELIRLNQMRSEFLSRVSHELRTPLTAILAFSNILSKNKDKTFTERQIKQLSLVSNNGWRLEGIIDDLLDVSRADIGAFQIDIDELDLRGLVKKSVEDDRSIFQVKRQDLKLSLDSSPLQIEGDEKRLSQVVGNLLTNASKYSPERAEINVCVSQTDDHAVIKVTDNGMGISKSNLRKLFIPFYRVDNELTRKEGGTGLGLAISKSIVDLHNGSIKIESKLGVGTSVSVALPLPN